MVPGGTSANSLADMVEMGLRERACSHFFFLSLEPETSQIDINLVQGAGAPLQQN